MNNYLTDEIRRLEHGDERGQLRAVELMRRMKWLEWFREEQQTDMSKIDETILNNMKKAAQDKSKERYTLNDTHTKQYDIVIMHL